MELTTEHYRRAGIAYNAYCKQTGGKSLVSGDKLPPFDALQQGIKDAWAASAIALSLDADRTIRRKRPMRQIPTSHRILASRLLDLAADKFHEHGCNDMDPEAFEDLEPQEIKELVDGFNAWRRGETGETCGDSDDPKWACGEIGDDMWMAYLSAVIGRESSGVEEANQ